MLINKFGMFNLKFSDNDDNVEFQYIIQGERTQTFYSMRLPVIYSEEFVPVTLKVSRGGL